jgi:FG-GAP repeat
LTATFVSGGEGDGMSQQGAGSRVRALRTSWMPMVVAVSALAFAPASANAATTSVDLLGGANLRLDGAATNDASATSVAAIGDINGDGRSDVMIGAPGASKNGRSNSGSVYIVYGQPDLTSIDLNSLGAKGFRIDGAASGDAAGSSVASAGDVNDDGELDFLIGAPKADNNGRNNSGSVYVVFGNQHPVDVDLAALGTGGFRIDGAKSGDQAGTSVGGGAADKLADGDVNGDGLDDIVIGAPFTDYNNSGQGGGDAGSAYVIFGKTTTTTIDLDRIENLSDGTFGYRIDGAAVGDNAGQSVARLGDVNGDGLADVALGAPAADNNSRTNSGSAYVVFGKAAGGTIVLNSLGSGGYRIDGASASGVAGSAVAGLGDLNGDGRPDLIMGAPHVGTAVSGEWPGAAYVVFGKATTTSVDLGSLGSAGYRLDGVTRSNTGAAVAGTGDLNGDGIRDMVIGAPVFDPLGRTNAGAAFVVFGKTTTTTVSLNDLGTQGYRLDGAIAGGQAGSAVAGALDTSGDAVNEVMIGAPGASNNGRSGSGSAYLLDGRAGAAPAFSPPAQTSPWTTPSPLSTPPRCPPSRRRTARLCLMRSYRTPRACWLGPSSPPRRRRPNRQPCRTTSPAWGRAIARRRTPPARSATTSTLRWSTTASAFTTGPTSP